MSGVLVTLKAQGRTLEERIDALNTAFVRIVNDSGGLQRIVKWDMAHGCVEFLIDSKIDRRKVNGCPVEVKTQDLIAA